MSIKNNKYIVKVDKDSKRLTRIFENLASDRECIIKSDSKDWYNPIKEFSQIIKTKRLVDENYIEPIWSVRHHNVIEQRLIRLKPTVEVEKIPGNKVVYFKFRRRKIV